MAYKDYFYGNKISEYGRKNGYVDYRTLAKAFDCVLNNYIVEATSWENWEQQSGFVDNSEEIEELEEKIEEIDDKINELFDLDTSTDEEYKKVVAKIEELEEQRDNLYEQQEELEAEQDEIPEIYQYYIVGSNACSILEEANEIVYYNEAIDCYVWCVTHWGTSWDYVLTSIPCEVDETL